MKRPPKSKNSPKENRKRQRARQGIRDMHAFRNLVDKSPPHRRYQGRIVTLTKCHGYGFIEPPPQVPQTRDNNMHFSYDYFEGSTESLVKGSLVSYELFFSKGDFEARQIRLEKQSSFESYDSFDSRPKQFERTDSYDSYPKQFESTHSYYGPSPSSRVGESFEPVSSVQVLLASVV